jgi:hypothetical protein
MLAPVTIDDSGTTRTIRCRNASIWPPRWTRLGTLAELRSRFTPLEYERARTWELVCGLQAMDPEKCSKCPYALREDGTPHVPSLTAPTQYHRNRKVKGR